jgi:hypothetical protein
VALTVAVLIKPMPEPTTKNAAIVFISDNIFIDIHSFDDGNGRLYGVRTEAEQTDLRLFFGLKNSHTHEIK